AIHALHKRIQGQRVRVQPERQITASGSDWRNDLPQTLSVEKGREGYAGLVDRAAAQFDKIGLTVGFGAIDRRARIRAKWQKAKLAGAQPISGVQASQQALVRQVRFFKHSGQMG